MTSEAFHANQLTPAQFEQDKYCVTSQRTG